jgi:hypothetical protein
MLNSMSPIPFAARIRSASLPDGASPAWDFRASLAARSLAAKRQNVRSDSILYMIASGMEMLRPRRLGYAWISPGLRHVWRGIRGRPRAVSRRRLEEAGAAAFPIGGDLAKIREPRSKLSCVIGA